MHKSPDIKKVYLQIFYNALSEYEKGKQQAPVDRQSQDFFCNYKVDPSEKKLTDTLTCAAPLLELPEEAMEQLLDTAQKVEADAELRAFFFYCCSRFYRQKGTDTCTDGEGEINKTVFLSSDELLSKLGDHSPLFPVLVLIAGVERLEAYFCRKGISREILVDTLSDLKIWMQNSYKRYGMWGLTPLTWLLTHISGRLFKLGRLQFVPAPFWGSIHVYKNNVTGQVTAFPEPGTCIRKDGLINGTNDIYQTEDTFVSKYEIKDGSVKGNPITPYGTVEREIAVLSCSEWQEVLKKGDMLLGVHIPEGGRMDYDQCGASFYAALEFFAEYFPEVAHKGFSCGSWLLDPQLRGLMPPTSNIVKFQKEFYLFPVKSGDEAILDRVFGCEREDFDKVVAVTALQRSIKEFMDAGGKLHSAGMFLLAEDLKWGSQVYQMTSDK